MHCEPKRKIFILLSLLLFLNNHSFAETVNDIQQLYGTWKSNECTVIFPVQIQGNNYFKVEYKKEDITKEWYEICNIRGITFSESLSIKDVIISKIFDKDFPLANELGVNEGIKISYNEELKKSKIKAQKIILIPEEVIIACIEYFDISGNRLQMTSSIFFTNSLIDDFIITEKLRKKGLF